MSFRSDDALDRLVSLLPLAHRQAGLSPGLRRVHQAFLRSLVERGRPLDDAELAAVAPGHDAAAATSVLVSLDLIVVNREGKPVGAYPLTVEHTAFEVTVNGNTIWAMCALDALSVAPVFDASVRIRSRCQVTGAEILVQMQGAHVTGASPGLDVQVGVWWRDAGPVAARALCAGIVFLRDQPAAVQWQAGRTTDHDFAPLPEAVGVGARFFAPLMASPEPLDAMAG